MATKPACEGALGELFCRGSGAGCNSLARDTRATTANKSPAGRFRRGFELIKLNEPASVNSRISEHDTRITRSHGSYEISGLKADPVLKRNRVGPLGGCVYGLA